VADTKLHHINEVFLVLILKLYHLCFLLQRQASLLG